MRALVIAALLSSLAPALHAQELIADAFGLYRPGPGTESRARWADGSRVVAGAPDHVLIFAGPKTLVAGEDQGHLVALSLDTWGNLAGDSARFVYHDGAEALAPVRFGLADHLFDAGPSARAFLAAATVDGRQSQRADYAVIADLASLTPRILPPAGPVPPDSAIDLGFGAMRDRFGNPVPDGIALTLMLTDAEGRHGQATALSRGGAASLPLILRDVAGPVQAVPSLGQATGPATPLEMAQPAAEGPLSVSARALHDIDALSLSIGPLQSSLGYVLPDGTLVEVTVQGRSGTRHVEQGWVLAGRVTGLVPLSPDDLPLAVSIRSLLGDQTGVVDTLSTHDRAEVME